MRLPRWPRRPGVLGPARCAYRLAILAPAKFSLANEAINYRRFFAVSDLAGVRVEDPEVFDATHALILALVDEGLVDGLRVDHIDGLRDPRAYLRRLRERAPRLGYLLVEKILAPGEAARGAGASMARPATSSPICSPVS